MSFFFSGRHKTAARERGENGDTGGAPGGMFVLGRVSEGGNREGRTARGGAGREWTLPAEVAEGRAREPGPAMEPEPGPDPAPGLDRDMDPGRDPVAGPDHDPVTGPVPVTDPAADPDVEPLHRGGFRCRLCQITAANRECCRGSGIPCARAGGGTVVTGTGGGRLPVNGTGGSGTLPDSLVPVPGAGSGTSFTRTARAPSSVLTGTREALLPHLTAPGISGTPIPGPGGLSRSP